jgi:hypothetical protein
LHFWGEEIGSLPAVGYGWVGNMDVMQIQTMRVFVYFLVFIIGSAVFADNFYSDLQSGILNPIITRCSKRLYFFSSFVVVFLSAFLIVFLPLLLSQLLACLIFPIDGLLFSGFNWPSYNSSVGFDMPLFPDLFYNMPVVQNLLFACNISFWAGTMALLAFTFSLFVRRSRLLILGIPTMLALISWFITPNNFVLFSSLYPQNSTLDKSITLFFVEPLVVLTLVF